jgi:AbiTii
LPLGSFRLTGPLGKELTNVGLHVDRAVFVNVVSVVRSKVAEWAVKLKKAGIKGEGLSFSEPEKKKAHDPGVTINIGRIGHLTGNVGEISGHATISSRTGSAPLDLEKVRILVEQIRSVGGLPEDENATVGQALSSLETELQKPKPEHSRIREILHSIRSVSEGAAGNVVALGIVQLITKVLSP